MSTFIQNWIINIAIHTQTREHDYLRRRLVFMDNNSEEMTNDH